MSRRGGWEHVSGLQGRIKAVCGDYGADQREDEHLISSRPYRANMSSVLHELYHIDMLDEAREVCIAVRIYISIISSSLMARVKLAQRIEIRLDVAVDFPLYSGERT